MSDRQPDQAGNLDNAITEVERARCWLNPPQCRIEELSNRGLKDGEANILAGTPPEIRDRLTLDDKALWPRDPAVDRTGPDGYHGWKAPTADRDLETQDWIKARCQEEDPEASSMLRFCSDAVRRRTIEQDKCLRRLIAANVPLWLAGRLAYHFEPETRARLLLDGKPL